jgi:hypothetical protein
MTILSGRESIGNIIDQKKTAIDADFSEVHPEEENKTTALAIINVEEARHPLMRGMENEAINKIKEEVALDEELGLKNQASINCKKALEVDIDELTSARDYYQVTKKIVGDIFGIPAFQFRCWTNNVKEAFTSSLKCGAWGFILSALAVGLFCGTIIFAHTHNMAKDINQMGMGAFIVGILGLVVGGIVVFVNTKWEYTFINVKLAMEPIEGTTIKIPYGAKLKIKEAKDSKIFENFVIAHPEFETEQRSYKMPEFQIDPAILGVTKDSRMFMIVYWDIEHDKEKIVKNLEDYKKFKLGA